MREQGFVGCDHIFAKGEGGFDCVFRNARVATDQFDENIHIVAFGQGDRISFPSIA